MIALARILALLLILCLIFAGSRALVHGLPGDPLETLLAESGTSVPRELLAAELGLDVPFREALVRDFRLALHGDLGRSIFSRQPIAPLLADRFVKTLELTLLALGLGIAAGLLLGLGAATQSGTLWSRFADRVCSFHGALASALPTPWLGPILMYALAVRIPLFPVAGGIALPALTLALGIAGLWSRLIRERVSETLRLGSAQAARARGIPEWKVTLKYGLVPAGGALAAYLGTQFGGLLGGAFVVETIFDWPGMGSLLVDAVLRRDYPVIEASVFAGAMTSLLGSAAGDWIQWWLNPKH